ncbi:MAG: transposase, partial [Saprospiraceae bacterium]
MKRKYQSARSKISMDNEIEKLQKLFESIKDKRAANSRHKLCDILMSGYAMFSLKYPSLLNFEEQNKNERLNLQSIFGVSKQCSDTNLRTVLDKVEPNFIREYFPQQFKLLENSGFIEEYQYKIGSKKYLIVSNDGVQHFSSKSCNCDKCLKKHHSNGSITYHHNMLCGALVHPDKREVFILDNEPIINEDGKTKNDCERNAAKRLLKHFGKAYKTPLETYNFLMVEDALYANEPHIKELKNKGFDYIINVKPTSQKTLFKQVEGRRKRKQTKEYSYTENGIKHSFEYINNLALTNSGEVRVNFLHYQQTTFDKKGKVKKITTFSWITSIKINKNNVRNIMKAGRSRWKIENETFNTLKNLGYHFEHNYGHGKDHLSTTFAFLMLLAFLIDQIIQAACHIFNMIEVNIRTKIKLWESIKATFHSLICESM